MVVMHVYVLSGEAVGNGFVGGVRLGATADIRRGHGIARRDWGNTGRSTERAH
ncbi:hypothetical protein GCM10009805_27970 [Leucobacter chromiireducens subsp. solipictus]